MISISSETSIKKGTIFSIKRAGEYIVQARVEKVFPDMIACVIDQRSWNTKGLQTALSDEAKSLLFQWPPVY